MLHSRLDVARQLLFVDLAGSSAFFTAAVAIIAAAVVAACIADSALATALMRLQMRVTLSHDKLVAVLLGRRGRREV